MKQWQYFSYISGCTAVVLMVVLALISIVSPGANPASVQTASSRTVSSQQPAGDPNTVEQFVQIIEPATVPQEVTILKR